MSGPTVRAVRVIWRLVPDDPESSMPPLESSRLPAYGDISPVWVRRVRTEILPGGDAEVTIDYVLAVAGDPRTGGTSPHQAWP